MKIPKGWRIIKHPFKKNGTEKAWNKWLKKWVRPIFPFRNPPNPKFIYIRTKRKKKCK